MTSEWKSRMMHRNVSSAFMCVLFIFLLCRFTAEVDASTRNILRVNDGLMFKHVRRVWPSSDVWVHSYFIEIPAKTLFADSFSDLLKDDPKNPTGNTSLHWMSYCFRYIVSKRNTSVIPVHLRTAVLAVRGSCNRAMPAIEELVRSLEHNFVLLNQHFQAIYDLLPPKFAGERANKKRAPLEIIGDLASSLFGVATHKQLLIVQKQIQKVAEVVSIRAGSFKKEIGDMYSLSKTMGERLNLLARELHDNRQAYNELSHYSESIREEISIMVDLNRKVIQANHASNVVVILCGSIHGWSGVACSWKVTCLSSFSENDSGDNCTDRCSIIRRRRSI